MRYDPTHEYQSVTLSDGCDSIFDVTSGMVAHGVSVSYFREWQRGDVEEIEFSDGEEIREYDETLHTPDAPADVILTAEPERTDLDALWIALGEEANRRQWCEEYDAFARLHGGPARPLRQRTYTVNLRVPVVLTITEHPDGVEAALIAAADANRDELLTSLRTALSERANQAQSASVSWFRDYAQVLQPNEPGRLLAI